MAASSGPICGVCNAQYINNCAEYWCPECNEGLCLDCHKYHSVSKASSSHGCIPIDQYNKLPSSISEIVHHCIEHGMKYTNYCPVHETLCCPECISTQHEECKGFRSITEVIKKAKVSTLLENMEQSVINIEKNIEKVIKNRKDNLENIRLQRNRCQDDFKKFRKKVDFLLNTMEQNMISEVDAAEKMIENKLQNLIGSLSKEIDSIRSLNTNIRILKEHASDLQTFLGSKTYQSELQKAEEYMKSLSEDGSLEQINLDCRFDDMILDTFGTMRIVSVSVEKGPSTLVLKTEKEKQAQLMTVLPQPRSNIAGDMNISLIDTYNIPKNGTLGYRGCSIHPNGKMMFIDRANDQILLWNADGTDGGIVPGFLDINDVTTIDDDSFAVSTNTGIKIIDTDSKPIEKVITTKHRCYGIAYHKGTLLWCEQSEGLQQMDLYDRTITTLVKQDQLPCESYVTTYGDNIYQTNYKADTVTCYSSKGKTIWEHKVTQPVGITVDNNGNVYVTSFASIHVVMISPDGENKRPLLIEDNKLKRPYGIYFDRTKNSLLIANLNGPAFLYHVLCPN